MTKEEFRIALDDLGISQLAFARAIRKNPRTVRRWLSGELAVPEIVASVFHGIKPKTEEKK